MATFSNGHEHKYGGKRDVRAAWMVVLPNGKIVSGHSLDKTKAEKTARATAADRAPVGQILKTGSLPLSYLVWSSEVAKEAGFKTVKAYNKSVKADRADFVNRCTIEVIEL